MLYLLFIPLINSTNNVDLISLLAREGLSLHVAQKKYNIQNVTTNDSDFYDGVDAVFIATPHETHFDFINRLIELKNPCLDRKTFSYLKE